MALPALAKPNTEVTQISAVWHAKGVNTKQARHPAPASMLQPLPFKGEKKNKIKMVQPTKMTHWLLKEVKKAYGK